jgi:hypothetical protein
MNMQLMCKKYFSMGLQKEKGLSVFLMASGRVFTLAIFGLTHFLRLSTWGWVGSAPACYGSTLGSNPGISQIS